MGDFLLQAKIYTHKGHYLRNTRVARWLWLSFDIWDEKVCVVLFSPECVCVSLCEYMVTEACFTHIWIHASKAIWELKRSTQLQYMFDHARLYLHLCISVQKPLYFLSLFACMHVSMCTCMLMNTGLVHLAHEELQANDGIDDDDE